MKRYLFVVLVFLCSEIHAQELLGIRPSNYSGLQSLGINPSNMVDSRIKLDINIISAGFTLENDYLFIPKNRLKLVGLANVVDRVETKGYLDDFIRGQADKKNINGGFSVMGPSLMMRINNKHSLAFTWQIKSAFSINDVLPEAARYSYTELEDTSLYTRDPMQFRARGFLFNIMAWQEYGISYGTILHQNEGHIIKGGATVKYLGGISAAYVKNADIYFNAADDSTLIFGPSRFEYGRVSYNTFDGDGGAEQRMINGSGFGWDLGFIYEFTKDPATYIYEMDGTKRNDPEQNKYKFRIGASLIDMGKINFKHNSRVFNINSQNGLHVYPEYNIDEFDNQLDFDSSVSAIFYGNGMIEPNGAHTNPQFFNDSIRAISFRNTKSDFTMQLPAAWSIQADWNIYKRFYLNGNVIRAFKHNGKQGVERANILAIAPRYESRWIDVSLPLSFIDFHDDATRLGFAMRIGSVFFGTDKLGTLLGISDLYGIDVYAGLKFSLLNLKERDRDNDRVSDKKDNCIDVPGIWKFKGCPDRDGDDIQDSEDACPDIAGLAKFNGCPDKDGDDIPDLKDDCPDEPGLALFNGCPDTDSDGIMDKQDSCITDAGPLEFNGCPDRDNDKIIDKLDECPDQKGDIIYNGCPDSDGDEIPDNKDHCPFEIGPLSNNGCPVKVAKTIVRDVAPIKIDLPVEEAEVLNLVVKNLQFETGKAIIKTVSFESLNRLADLLKRKSEYQLTIEGHTDNVGSANMNMSLSARRARAAKEYLVKQGVNASRITSTGYGLTRPVAPNTTPEGRQQNRRVEFTIVR